MSVELNRASTDYIHRRPKVILDSRFKATGAMNVLDKGQLDVNMVIHSIDIVKDEKGNDIREVTLIINSAEIIKQENNRYV